MLQLSLLKVVDAMVIVVAETREVVNEIMAAEIILEILDHLPLPIHPNQFARFAKKPVMKATICWERYKMSMLLKHSLPNVLFMIQPPAIDTQIAGLLPI